jgi:hypothetical protein
MCSECHLLLFFHHCRSIKTLTIGPDAALVSIIMFSEESKVVLPLNSGYTKSKINHFLTVPPYNGKYGFDPEKENGDWIADHNAMNGFGLKVCRNFCISIFNNTTKNAAFGPSCSTVEQDALAFAKMLPRTRSMFVGNDLNRHVSWSTHPS